MRVRHACLAGACLAAGVVTGCGSAQTSGLSASSAGTLRSRLAVVASDAARGNRAGALAALSAVSAEVTRDASRLSSAERTALRTGIARVRTRIIATVPPPAATTAAAPTTSTTAPASSATTASASAPGPPAPPGRPGEGRNGPGPPGHDHGGRPPGHGHHPGQGDGRDGGGD
jgi:hypothetical protein